MRDLNERIKNIPVPPRMRKLAIDDRGFPIPKFVPYVDGKPEFRGMDGVHFKECIRRKLCWLCAEPLGVRMTFVIGPMCGINRINAEPPCHADCARYAAMACPFLSQPKMRRNEKDTPWDDFSEGVAGVGITRNPGVALLWTTRSYKIMRVANGTGVLFTLGDPERIECYAEGRKATLDEVMHSIETGLPLLHAEAVKDGPEAITMFENMAKHGIALIKAHMGPLPK
jgi:hypothetical protein